MPYDLLNGKMYCGIWQEFLIVRIGPEAYAGALVGSDTRECPKRAEL